MSVEIKVRRFVFDDIHVNDGVLANVALANKIHAKEGVANGTAAEQLEAHGLREIAQSNPFGYYFDPGRQTAPVLDHQKRTVTIQAQKRVPVYLVIVRRLVVVRRRLTVVAFDDQEGFLVYAQRLEAVDQAGRLRKC